MVAWVAGLIVGFVNSIPIGPVNIAIVETTLRRGVGPALAIAGGALVVDTFYCGVGIFGATFFIQFFRTWLAPLGCVIIVVSGLRLLFYKAPQTINQDRSQSIKARFFLFGALLYLGNYLAISFWLLMGGLLTEQGWISSLESQVSFMIGMILGTAGWFFALAKLIDIKKHRLNDRAILFVTKACGAMLLGFGIFLAFRIYEN